MLRAGIAVPGLLAPVFMLAHALADEAGRPKTAAVSDPADLAIDALSDGSLAVRASGQALWIFRPSTEPLRRGPLQARALTIAGRGLVEVSIPIAGRAARELWLGERLSSARHAEAVRPLWHGVVGALDTDGEHRFEVEIASDGIVAFQTAATITRCDGPARLYPQFFDFEQRRFVALASMTNPRRALSLLPSLVVEVPGPHPKTQRPQAGFRWIAASDQADAEGDARKLVPPTALSDNDPFSTWRGAATTAGQPELGATSAAANIFFTARGPKSAPITGLRIWPARARADIPSLRPREIMIALGPNPEQQFGAELPREGDGPFWIPLPRPMTGGCVTLAITSVYPARVDAGEPRPALELGEIEIFSVFDQEDGLTQLADGLASGQDCTSWLHILTQVRASASAERVQALLSTLAERTGSAPLAGQACLLRALAADPSPRTGNQPLPRLEVLANLATLLDSTVYPEAVRAARALLLRMGAPAVPFLSAQLAHAPDRALRAAALLAELADPTADRVLLAALDGPRTRLAARAALARHAPRLSAALLAELLANPLPAKRHADYLYLLAHALAAGSALPASSDAKAAISQPISVHTALQAVERALSSPEFEVQARALAVLARLSQAEARTRMVSVMSELTDPVLRALAIERLLPVLLLWQDDPPARAALVAALSERLDDRDPRVRELAARALARLHATDAGVAILRTARHERWPFAQVGQAVALGALCPEGSHAWFEHALVHGSGALRRVVLDNLVSCRHPRAHAILLDVVSARHADPALRERAARLYPAAAALGQEGTAVLGPKSVARFDEAVAHLLQDAAQDLALEAAALAALAALAEIAPERALVRCLSLAETGRLSEKRAAIEILGMLCDPTRGAAALERARALEDPWLARPAHAAIARCAGRSWPGRPEPVTPPEADSP